jgi:hypothetical protein
MEDIESKIRKFRENCDIFWDVVDEIEKPIWLVFIPDPWFTNDLESAYSLYSTNLYHVSLV